jgi:autotransporter-associated beta strand protein
MMKKSVILGRVSVFTAILTLLFAKVSLASNGAWYSTNGVYRNTFWTNSWNWSASPYPSGNQTATFNNSLNTTNTTLDLSGLSIISNIVFDASGVASYTLGSNGVNQQALVLPNGSIVQITSTAVNGQRINAAVLLGNDRSASTHTFRNDQPYGTLTLAGDVTTTNSGGTAGAKTLNIAGIGNVTLGGNILLGGATSLTLTDATAGTLLLTGSSNRINTVNVNSGTLTLIGTNLFDTVNVNNDSIVNSYGTNSLQTMNINGTGRSVINVVSGWLSFTNGGGGTLLANQNVVINGPGLIVLPAGPANNPTGDNYAGAGKTLVINAGLTGPAGLELWSGSGTYVLNGTNDFLGNVTMGPAGTLSVARIGNKGSTTSNLGQGTTVTLNASGTRLLYTGAGETSDRIFTLNSSGCILDNSGTGYLKLTSPISVAAGGKTLILQGSTASAAEFAGQLRNDSGALSLLKDGTGTWCLSTNNTYTGTTVLNNGTLALTGANGAISASTAFAVSTNSVLLLNNTSSVNNTNRISDTATISLCGGTLSFSNNGSSASYSENLGAVTVNQGYSTVATVQAAAGQTATLRFASLTHAAAGTVNFTGTELGDDTRNRIYITSQADGLIGPWATVNGTNLAAYSSAKGVYASSDAASYTDIAARGPSSTIVSNAASYVRINLPGDNGPIQLGSPVTRITALVQNTAVPATIATADKTLQTSVLSVPSGMASITVGENANEGTLAPLAANGELALNNAGANDLTVNAVIANNGTAPALTKYGGGNATLTATNTFSGTVTVCEGALVLAQGNALQNATLSTAGIVFDSSVVSHAFTLGGLSGASNLSLADNAGSPNAVALTIGKNNASTTYAGSLTGAGSLTKIGTGTLTLSGTNSLTGGLAVSAGTVTASALGALGPGPVTNNATLNLTAGAVTYSGLSTALSGSGTVNVTLSTGSSTTYLNGDYSGFTGVWNIGVGAGVGSSKVMMNGPDNGAATVVVRTNATLMASTAVNHAAALTLQGGSQGEPNGQLRIESGAQWSGNVTLANNIVGVTNGFFGCTAGTGTISGVISDIGGAHSVAKLGGGTLALTGINTYAGDTSVRAGTLAVNSIRNVGQASALGAPANATDGTIKIGTNSTAATLSYFGPGDTSDRIISLNLTNGTATIDMSGTGPLKFTSDLASPLTGTRTLMLQGSTTGTAEFAGSIINGGGSSMHLYKSGSGTWTLSGANTYAGETTITGGKLIAANPGAIGTNGTLHFTGSTGILELDNDGGPAEAGLKIDTGVGNIGTLAIGRATPGDAITHVLGTLTLSTVTLNVTNGANVTSGTPSVQFTSLNMGGGSGGTTYLIPSSASLCINGPASIYSNGGNAKGPQLDGTSTGNAIMGSISNGLGTVFLTKANTSTWTLCGSNTFSGATTINGGLLVLAGTNGALLGTSGITLSGNSTLTLFNTATTNNANRIGDAVPVTLAGGTLNFTNDSGAANFAETAGTLAIGTGTNRLNTSQAANGQSSILTFASLTHSGGVIDFCGAGLGMNDQNKVLFTTSPGTGLIGLWATCNSTNFAAYDSSLGVVAAGDSAFTNLAAKGPATIPNNASLSAQIVSEGTDGPIALAGTTTSNLKALLQNSQWDSTVAMTNQTLLVDTLMIAAGQASLTLGTAENEGLIMPPTAGGTFTLINQSGNTLTLNAAVTNNSSASSIAKFGPGNVTLNGRNTYSGTTLINDGTLEFGGGSTQTLAGVISGSGSLVKSGSGKLILPGANTYSGLTTIKAGTVVITNNASLGSSVAGTVIEAGATLDVGGSSGAGNGLSLNAEQITVSGAGVNGRGAIINSSNLSQYNVIRLLTLADDTTFGGEQSAGRWDVRNSGGNASFVMNDHAVTKVGSNLVGLTSVTVVPGSGSIDVREGSFTLEGSTVMGGSSANLMTVENGATFDIYMMTTPVLWGLVMNENSRYYVRQSGTTTQNNWAGPVTLNGRSVFDANSGYYGTISGDIAGTGSFVKFGAGTLYLASTNNTYSGTTTISNGTLYAQYAGSLPGYDSGKLTLSSTGILALPTGDGTTGWNAGQIKTLCAASTFTASTVSLSIDTTLTSLTYDGSLVKPMALIKQGTNTLSLLGTNTFAGAVTVNGGTLVFGNTCSNVTGAITLNNASSMVFSGPALNNNSAVTINNTGKAMYAAGTTNTIGSITVNGGLLDFDVGSTNTIGAITSKAGSLVVIDGSTSLGVNTFTVGNAGGDRPMLLITTNATFNKLFIGNAQNAAGSVIQSGGTFIVGYTNISTDVLSVGNSGGYGYYRLNAGTLATGQFGITGGGAGANNCVVDLVDGTAACTATNGWLIWGWSGGNGVLNLFNASLAAPPGGNDTTFAYAASRGSFGMLNLLGPRAVLNATGGGTARGVNMALSGNNAGAVVNLNSGVLVANQVRANVTTTPTFFNFGGGTLKANVNQTQFMQGLTAATVYPGGATIDTTNVNVTVTQSLRAPTGYGVGSITVTSGGQGYIGAPVVIISGGSGTGATAIATVDLNTNSATAGTVTGITVTSPGTGYLTSDTLTVSLLGGGFTNSMPAVATALVWPNTTVGGLAKLGTGILTLGGTNTYGGTTTISAGTLKLGNALALPSNTSVVLAGGTLDLNGFTATNTISGVGTVTNGTVFTVISPAGEGVIGTNTLTLGSAILKGTYRADVTQTGTSDLVAVQGDIDLSGLSLSLVNTDLLDRTQLYTILTCTGNRTGTFASNNLPNSRWHVLATGKTVKLAFIDGTVLKLR